MDEQISTFLAVTGASEESVAKQFLDLTNGDLEYAVTLYMESNLQGGGNNHNDEALANQLQNETNLEGVREADTNIHRHETLMDSFGDGGFYGVPQPRQTGIFGNRAAGIFNQRFDDDETEYYQNRQYDSGEDFDDPDVPSDEQDIIIIDSDDEETTSHPRPMSRRRMRRNSRQSELTSTQRRLANLFRPPFDIMERVDLNTAKKIGRDQSKWILVNIQDSTQFTCQVMNRDFWSDKRLKEEVKQSFVFIQYQNDSPNGINYLQFYSSDEFPHLAILDPLTGERVKEWKDGEVPKVDEWLKDVRNFLANFQVSSDSGNPVVSHGVRFDPGSMTEEQQIEYAMKQSIQDDLAIPSENPPSLGNDQPEPEISENISDTFARISPQDVAEPSSGLTTRIQIRFPNGKRVVRKLAFDDKVVIIYQWIKYLVAQDPSAYGLLSSDDRFTISNLAKKDVNLINDVDKTVEEMNLKNDSLLLEKD